MLGRTDGWAQTLVYGAAHYGKSLFWYGGEVLFAFFLTDVVGLAPAAMGAVLGIGFLISAVFDLLVGRWMARNAVTLTRVALLQMIGAVVGGVVLVSFFATTFLPDALRLTWALCAGTLFRLCYSIYDVPQGALMALAADGEAARARVAGVRITGSGLAGITVAAVVAPLIGTARAGSGGLLMVGLAAVAALIAGLSAAWLWTLLRSDGSERLTQQDSLASRRIGLGLWPLWAMMAVMMLGPPLFQKLEPYFASRSFPSAAIGGAIIMAVAVGVTLGQPVWLRSGNIGYRVPLFLIAAALQAAGALLFLFASIDRPDVLIAAAWLFGLGNGGVGMAKWATYSDAVARRPAKQHGLCFAVFGAVAKVSLAVGVVMAAWIIDASQTRPDLLRQAMAVGPIIASLVMVLLALIWFSRPRPLSEDRCPSIEEAAAKPG